MGVLNPLYCSASGHKTNLLTRTKLADGEILCYECASIIPRFMYSTVTKRYTLDDYLTLREYVDYSNTHLRPIFHETKSYYILHLDVANRLFYIGQKIDSNTVFFRLRDVEQFDLIFNAQKFHSNLLGDKVTGEILLQLEMKHPYFYCEETLCLNAKGKARKMHLGTQIDYENPEGMDEFFVLFMESVNAALEEYREELRDNLYGDDDNSDYHNDSYATNPSELQQAMALFMIDSLDNVTLTDIRAIRNRMIKAFHPDKGSSEDTKYAQKINNAYEVLKEHLE